MKFEDCKKSIQHPFLSRFEETLIMRFIFMTHVLNVAWVFLTENGLLICIPRNFLWSVSPPIASGVFGWSSRLKVNQGMLTDCGYMMLVTRSMICAVLKKFLRH